MTPCLQLLHYGCIHFGYRFLWRHKRVLADVGDEGLLLGEGDKNSLNLPDWGQQGLVAGGSGGQGDNVDITSDSFRHRFFEANKPWIIQQLRKTMSPRAQLEALTKGELLPEGPDTKRGWIRGECRSRLDGVPARTASRAQPRPKLCRQ